LNLQKQYYDLFYNWDIRINQWTSFLESLKMGIEDQKATK